MVRQLKKRVATCIAGSPWNQRQSPQLKMQWVKWWPETEGMSCPLGDNFRGTRSRENMGTSIDRSSSWSEIRSFAVFSTIRTLNPSPVLKPSLLMD